jgi:hypothetical protein
MGKECLKSYSDKIHRFAEKTKSTSNPAASDAPQASSTSILAPKKLLDFLRFPMN